MGAGGGCCFNSLYERDEENFCWFWNSHCIHHCKGAEEMENVCSHMGFAGRVGHAEEALKESHRNLAT